MKVTRELQIQRPKTPFLQCQPGFPSKFIPVCLFKISLDSQLSALVAGHLVRPNASGCGLAGLSARRQIDDYARGLALFAHGVLEEFHLAARGDCVQAVCGCHGVQVGAAAGATHAGVNVVADLAVALCAGVQVEGPLDAALHEGEGDGHVDQEKGGEEADSERHFVEVRVERG